MTQMNAVDNLTLQIRCIRTTRWLWIDNAVYDRYAAQLGPEGLGVYVGLARYANNKTGKCWPSMARLATDMGTDLSTIEAALERIMRAGLLHVTQEPGKGTVLTLLDAQAAVPPPAPVVETSQPPLAGVEEVSREDEQDVRTKHEEEKKSVVRVVEGRGREQDDAPDISTRTLDPSVVSPYELAADTRAEQCAGNLVGIAACLAALSAGDAVVQQTQAHKPRCPDGLHLYRDKTGTACYDCGEVLAPAAAD